MPALVAPLEWDTTFWGVRAACVSVDAEEELVDALRICADLDIEWSSLLVASTKPNLLSAALGHGYRLVDTRYEMIAALGNQVPADAEAGANAEAGPNDIEALADIARAAFSDSRFFNDDRLDDIRCAEFYETWLRNSIRGDLADAVVVDRIGAHPAGFVTIALHGDHGALPLVAVAPAHQGQGVGRRLLTSTFAWLRYNNATQVEVVTQLTNVGAIALYTSAGFRLQRSGFWLHRWSP